MGNSVIKFDYFSIIMFVFAIGTLMTGSDEFVSSNVNGTKYTSGGYKYYKFTGTGAFTY